MTAEELANLPDSAYRHELIKGELLTMPLPQLKHARVAAKLTIKLGQYVEANQLGDVFAEGGYHIEKDPDTVLGPDVSFIARGHDTDPPDGYNPGPPDLAIEVVSPGDRRGRIQRKLGLWLEAGTRSVWLVNPRHRTVEVISSTGDRRMLHEDDELVDDTVPGFRIKVSEIFA